MKAMLLVIMFAVLCAPLARAATDRELETKRAKAEHSQLSSQNAPVIARIGTPPAATPAYTTGQAPGVAALLNPTFREEEKRRLRLPPPESASDHFFRTGIIYQHVGPKITSQFWAKGDEGIMLSYFF